MFTIEVQAKRAIVLSNGATIRVFTVGQRYVTFGFNTEGMNVIREEVFDRMQGTPPKPKPIRGGPPFDKPA